MTPRWVERRLGGDDADLGMLVAVYAVAAIACRPFVARVGRSGARGLMGLGGIISALGMSVHAFAGNLGVVAVGRGVLAVGETLLFVGFASRITAIAPSGREAEYTSVGSVAVFAALGTGPLLGEFFVDRSAWEEAFLTGAALCLAAGLLALVVVRADGTGTDRTRAGDRTGAGDRPPAFHRDALPTGSVLGLIMAAYFAWNTYIALHADDLGMDNAAGIFVVYSVVTLTARLAGAKVPERIGLFRSVRIAAAGVAVGLMVTAAWASPAGVYLGTVVLSLALAFAYPALTALTLQATRPSERTSVLSTFTMFFEVGSGLAGLSVGPVAEAAGRRAAFVVGAGASAVALAVMTPVSRWIGRRAGTDRG